MRWQPSSIRARLIAGLLLVLLSVDVALLLSNYRAAHHEVDELFDAHLAQSARVLRKRFSPLGRASGDPQTQLVDEFWRAAEGTVFADDDDPYGHPYESKIAFQLIGRDGGIRARSESAPLVRFMETDRGFTTVALAGSLWRVFSVPAAGERGVVQVGQKLEIREELEQRIAVNTIQTSLLGLPVLVLLVWLAVGVGLNPLKRLTGEIQRRSEARLDPVVLPSMPSDLRPIVEALNSLFARLSAAWKRERRFLDEAAHELRTPLSAIRLHAESLAQAADEDSREYSQRHLLAASAAGARLASQLLTLARVESSQARDLLEPTAVGPLFREEVAMLAPLAEQRDVELCLDLEPSLPQVNAAPGLLPLLVRNLVGNAIRYSPSGGCVDVRARKDEKHVVVTVDDHGPGIPLAQRERVLERFMRIDKSGEGSGLGLAIAARIAEIHGCALELLDNPSGSGLRVLFRLVSVLDTLGPSR
ncbi:ATP-binding protein [Spectribacter hydrogenooxidans]|uniref:histidine kinase n=1 Tax=Spectribacter hydrogenoxidans TaxID=3075608 RepID=A0ABU3C2V7_9GAMM|nr:ATP-binding protein [Salinisphaera sp. W335]MDT0635881.1 ATP-binding protein [Salinisphaera sp. W335]